MSDVFGDDIHDYYISTYFADSGLRQQDGPVLREDLDLRAVEEEWLSCLESHSFEGIETAHELPDYVREHIYDEGRIDLPDHPGAGEAKQNEVALAEADYGCNEEVGFDEARIDLMWSEAEQYLAESAEEIFAWQEEVDEYLAAAQVLLVE